MSLRALVLAFAFVTVALAGCSDKPAPSEGEQPEFGVAPTDTTGIIRGVLVDAAVRPLSGVKVVATAGGVTKEAVTTDNGLFGFGGLAPGSWALLATKPGFFEARSTAFVEAGEAEPPIVKMLLIEDVENRPYVEAYVWTGFLECSAGIPEVGSVNPCFITPSSSNVWNQSLERVPTFVQAEMVWRPTTAVGSSFWLSSFVDSEADPLQPDDYAEVQGMSPLVLPIATDLLAQKGVGADQELAFRVFPGTDQPTAFVQQAFDVYIHVFYGYEPPAGWQFSVDESVPTPS